MSEIVLTKDNFNSEVTESDMPVLVDFYADWCQPCKMLGPVVEEIAEEYAGKIKVGKLNIDDNPEIAQQFGVMSIPTLIYFKDGKAANKSVGYVPKEDITAMFD